MRRTSFLLLLLFASVAARADARIVKHDELNFTIVVPDRLQHIKPQPEMVDAFATSDPAQGLPDAVVSITRLHGTIGREPLDPSTIPGVANVRVRQQKWKEFDVSIVEGEVSPGNIRMAVRGAQIPLKQEAIQINILAPAGKEVEADALMTELLAGLDGPTNWLTSEERGRHLGEGLGRMAFWVAVLAVGLFAGIRALRKRAQ